MFSVMTLEIFMSMNTTFSIKGMNIYIRYEIIVNYLTGWQIRLDLINILVFLLNYFLYKH